MPVVGERFKPWEYFPFKYPEVKRIPLRSTHTLREPNDRLLRFLREYEFKCYYCCESGNHINGPDGLRWEVDHKIPKSKSGSDCRNNLVLSCATCNRIKFTYDYEDFSLYVICLPLTQSAFMKMFRLGGVRWSEINQKTRGSYRMAFRDWIKRIYGSV